MQQKQYKPTSRNEKNFNKQHDLTSKAIGERRTKNTQS